jgi:Rrf2 family protein
MEFKSRTQYALLAVLDLAAHYKPEKPVKLQEIADRTGAPAKYLGQILGSLKKRALVKSSQGPSGGYWLMRRPALISVAEVWEAVGGGEDRRRRRGLPESRYSSAVGWLSGRLERQRNELLSGISLADFLGRAGAR